MIELQRFVDGELDHSQRCQVLNRLDEQPTQWRRLALALLEERDFQRELGSASNRPMDSFATGSSSTLACTTAHADVKHPSSYRWSAMAMAASLLFGLGLAGGNWLARQFDVSRTSASTTAATTSLAATPTHDQSTASNRNDPTLKPVGQLSFTSDIANNAHSQAVRVPVYEAAPEHVSRVLWTQQQQVEQWNQHLRRRGYELDWQPEMLKSRLPDGRAVIVPIQHVQVRSLGQ